MKKPTEHFTAERQQDNSPPGGTIAKGFALLDCFADEPYPLGNSELAARLGYPKPTVSRLCKTLCDLGYLDWDPRLDKYFIGAQVLALGYPYLVGLHVRHLARPLMQTLADRIQGAVSLGVARGLDVVYLETCTYHEGTLARPGVGASRSVITTAMGRAYLSTLSAKAFDETMQLARAERPHEYAAWYDTMCRNIALYPQRGFALNEGDAGSNVHGVGIASRVLYHHRPLLFNCAIQGSQLAPGQLETDVARQLADLVRMVEAAAGTPLPKGMA